MVTHTETELEAALAEHRDAAKAARRAEKLARRIAAAEAIAAARAKGEGPSGLGPDDVGRWADCAVALAEEAGALLPQVEQLCSEISIFERQLKEAAAAAVWGAGGGNETERKNNAARALAADPEVGRLQAALDAMNRRLAVIEPQYKAAALKSGAWRAVCELWAGWLQSLR